MVVFIGLALDYLYRGLPSSADAAAVRICCSQSVVVALVLQTRRWPRARRGTEADVAAETERARMRGRTNCSVPDLAVEDVTARARPASSRPCVGAAPSGLTANAGDRPCATSEHQISPQIVAAYAGASISAPPSGCRARRRGTRRTRRITSSASPAICPGGRSGTSLIAANISAEQIIGMSGLRLCDRARPSPRMNGWRRRRC